MGDYAERRGEERRRITLPWDIDYKDLESLVKAINSQGQIHGRRRTGLDTQRQKALKKALKRARHLALLPFVS